MFNSNEFELVYNINANEKFFFNDITLELPDEFNKDNFSNLEKIFENAKDTSYSIITIEEILDEEKKTETNNHEKVVKFIK